VKTLVIAEVGVNHNGDLELAKSLVASAKFAGADVVKFQSFKASQLVTASAQTASYQKRSVGEGETQLAMLRKLELTREEHKVLAIECEKQGIEFCSTAFDADSFDMLIDLGLKRVKIPSGEINNLPLLRYMTRLGLPVILSTGMATLGEIETALDVIECSGTARELVTVLQCTTEYPAPMNEVNLRAMVSMGLGLGVAVGYSDHTLGIEIPIAAVALGASVVEKHLTLDKTLLGPDHLASLEPNEFKAMVRAVRNLEMALGDGVKRPSASELNNKPIARKSVVAIREIRAGELFSVDNIGTKRPGNGISPMRWDELIGRPAVRDFAIDEQIEI